MAASLLIEEETGTFTGRHSHNGYCAGDFSTAPGTTSRNSDEPATILTFHVESGTERMAA